MSCFYSTSSLAILFSSWLWTTKTRAICGWLFIFFIFYVSFSFLLVDLLVLCGCSISMSICLQKQILKEMGINSHLFRIFKDRIARTVSISDFHVTKDFVWAVVPCEWLAPAFWWRLEIHFCVRYAYPVCTLRFVLRPWLRKQQTMHFTFLFSF